MDWFPSLFAAIAALGFAFDRLLLRRLKVELYEKLQDSFIWLDDIRVAEYPKHIARRLRRWISRIFGERILSLRSVCLTLLLSWLSVTVVAAIFYYRNPYPGENCCEEFLSFEFLPFYPFYIVNFITDFLSLVLTVIAIRAVVNLQRVTSALILLADGIIALILMIVTFSTVHWISEHRLDLPFSERFIKPKVAEQTYQLGRYFAENRSPSVVEHQIFESIDETPEELQIYFRNLADDVENNEGVEPSRIDSFHVHIALCHDFESCIIYAASEFLDSFFSGYEILSGIDRFNEGGSRRRYISLVSEDLADHHSNYIGVQWRDSKGTVFSKKIVYGSFTDMFGVLSTTTLLPSLLLIFLLVGIGILHSVHIGLIKVGRYFTEKATENDPRVTEKLFLPGTTIGITAGLMTEIVSKIF